LCTLHELALGFRGDFNRVGHRSAGTKANSRSCVLFII
jgi:hypothetical protein